MLFRALQHLAGLEGEEVTILALGRLLDLLPRDRRRNGGPLLSPQRVHGDGRLVLVVLAPVHQHLPPRRFFAIRETTRSGSARSSACATACANGFVSS